MKIIQIKFVSQDVENQAIKEVKLHPKLFCLQKQTRS